MVSDLAKTLWGENSEGRDKLSYGCLLFEAGMLVRNSCSSPGMNLLNSFVKKDQVLISLWFY